MRKFLMVLIAVAMAPVLVPASASAHAYAHSGPRHHNVQALHREVAQDRRECPADRPGW